MKKNLQQLLGIILAVCMAFSGGAVSAFASENDPTSSPGISTYSYNGPFNYTVHGGTNTTTSKNHDGNYMAFEISASSSTTSTVDIELHIAGYKTYYYTVPCNGQTVKYDWIYMGSSGNHSCYWVEYCGNNNITFNIVSYSWQS